MSTSGRPPSATGCYCARSKPWSAAPRRQRSVMARRRRPRSPDYRSRHRNFDRSGPDVDRRQAPIGRQRIGGRIVDGPHRRRALHRLPRSPYRGRRTARPVPAFQAPNVVGSGWLVTRGVVAAALREPSDQHVPLRSMPAAPPSRLSTCSSPPRQFRLNAASSGPLVGRRPRRGDKCRRAA